MSKGMDALITETGIRSITKEEFIKIKEEYGYQQAFNALGRDLTTELGLHPLKEISLLENYTKQIPESYDEEYSITFSFSYKRNHYIYHEQG